MLRTGSVVVRRMTRVSPSANSTARVVSETSTAPVWCWWMRPRAIFYPTTMITPVLLARRWTRTGSAGGRGGGPASVTRKHHLLPGQALWMGWRQGGGGGASEGGLLPAQTLWTGLP